MTPPQAGVRAEKRNGALAIFVISLLFAVQASFRFQSSLNHDSSWFIHVARGLLGGKHLYTDFLEVNPPLGMWLTVPIVGIAKALNIRADDANFGVLLFVSAICTGLVNRYLKLGEQLSQSQRLTFVVVFVAGILFLPGVDFAEREHLIALLFAPWLFLRLARHKASRIGVVEAVCIGILAAIAILLKPQSAFAPVLVEAVLLWQSRKVMTVFAPENLAAGTTVLAYAAAILYVTPDFLTTMVPLGRAAYLPFYGYPAYVQLFNARWSLLFILTAAFAFRFLAGRVKLPALTLIAAAIGFTLSFAIQNKGFSYQILPATIFAWAALALALVVLLKDRQQYRFILSLIACLALLRISTEPQTYLKNDEAIVGGMNRYAPDAKSIFIASTRMSHVFPLVEEKHLRWASRLPAQWLAPYVASKWQDGPLPDDKIVHLALETTVTDLVEGQPDIVFIDQNPDQVYVPGGRFDYLKFWSMDPRFSIFWKNYEKRGTQGTFDIFTRK